MKWIQFRHLLHECAESSGNEWKTRECLRQELSHHRGCLMLCCDTPSMMMHYDFSQDKTVMIRAEMDGLCIQEANGCSYKSKTDHVMHACGHDGHMTILCALSERLSALQAFGVNVLLVFQSSEETGAGAKHVLNHPKFASICPDVCCALHVMPQMKKGFYTKTGVMCAGGRELDLIVHADAGHCASRKEDALSQSVHYLEELSHLNIEEGFASFHVIKAGQVRNQLAEASMSLGTMRFLSHVAEMKLISWMKNNLPDSAELQISKGYPVLYNSAKIAEAAFCAGCQKLENPLWICDDFAFYAQCIPSVYVLMGQESEIPLHHSCFDFDDEGIDDGVEFLLKFLKEC